MPFPEKVAAAVSWMMNNKPAVYRVIYLLQGALGLFLIVFGYWAGKDHFHLIRDGVRTQGIIVGHATEYFRDSSRNTSTTAYMPIVEFRAGDRVIHFKNWLGSSSTGNLHTSVVVLYDPADPTSAMIDRPVMNWIPWAPCLAVGAFLVLVSIKNTVGATNFPPPGTPIS